MCNVFFLKQAFQRHLSLNPTSPSSLSNSLTLSQLLNSDPGMCLLAPAQDLAGKISLHINLPKPMRIKTQGTSHRRTLSAAEMLALLPSHPAEVASFYWVIKHHNLQRPFQFFGA